MRAWVPVRDGDLVSFGAVTFVVGTPGSGLKADADPGRVKRVTVVLLVRHGLTAGTGHVLTGRTPGIPLDDRGREQAAALAARLAEVRLD